MEEHMTNAERQTIEMLKRDQGPEWGVFIDLISPRFKSAISRVVEDNATVEDLMGELMVTLVAGISRFSPVSTPALKRLAQADASLWQLFLDTANEPLQRQLYELTGDTTKAKDYVSLMLGTVVQSIRKIGEQINGSDRPR
jgi:DNA-directed RNA polymerase specialized sigma24 family protein